MAPAWPLLPRDRAGASPMARSCFSSFWRRQRRKSPSAWRCSFDFYRQHNTLDADAIERDERLRMLGLLWLVPAIPFASALALAVLRFPRRAVAWIATGSIAASSVVSLLVTFSFLNAPPAANAYTQVLWRWLDVDGLRPEIALYLDPLSLIMMVVVAFVSFLIHLYSTEFMIGDEGYGRFFAYMNLFVASMLTLLLADNLLLLYLGWEGVGLCSYLLIGFWYRDPANGRAGRKAFIVTRVGDTAMVIGLFLLFHDLGTLEHPGAHAAGLATLADRFRVRDRGRAVAAGRRRRQVGAAAVADLAARMPWPAPRRSAP